ncbi:hypothetical protein SAMN05661080_05152 [Modestobacter sp. DSM 44400]|uniref:hypothetical protein n=1 Tax=Modestobacter sp. DSM 44400 TaxID=1550230 RepID=UPI00089D4405|nr:hypothetical protein [Modestobacter sp. DSM 44400]SDY96460.1 hypothetical protein SAMN05661080_05152 [Modestobacter sp. DSM 44400]
MLAPERLRRFVAMEWHVPPMSDTRTGGWQAEHWEQFGPFYAWRDARRIWSADHGDALGDCIERLLFERDVYRGLSASIHEGIS